jgi:CRISPR/Cas system-associated exonuclease Cas4 (RecB family)
MDFNNIENEIIKDLASKFSLNDILNALEVVKKWYKPLEFVNTIETEKEFSVNIDNDILIGRIDRIDKVDDTYIVIDYKTGNSEVDLENSIQLYIYAYVVFKLYQAQKIIVSYVYIDKNTTVSNTYFIYDFEHIENLIRSYIAAIKNDNTFLPRINIYCLSCPYNNICSAFLKYIATINININSSIEDLSEEFVKNYFRQKYYTQFHEQLQNIIGTYMSNNNINEIETNKFKILLTKNKSLKIIMKK